MPKVALITGITGQDGSLLARYLLDKGYIVHGIKRRSSSFNTQRIDNIYVDRHEENARFFLHYGDLTDSSNLIRIIKNTEPDEIYNLGAMSHVHVSFEVPEYSGNVDGLGTLRILEAVRLLGMESNTKIYQASTSELYGKVAETPQNERTPFYPRSPYAAAKLYAYWLVVNYREAYDMFACNGILFNHESHLRGETFVTRKVTQAVAKIVLGQQSEILLGNLDAKRDWGHARDYIEAMHLMLQQPTAEDFVIATGECHTVRDLVRLAFNEVGITLEFRGKGLYEKGVISDIDKDKFYQVVGAKSLNLKVGAKVVSVHSEYFRPNEVDILLGDAGKARRVLRWQPKYSFAELIQEMVFHDLDEQKSLQKNIEQEKQVAFV